MTCAGLLLGGGVIGCDLPDPLSPKGRGQDEEGPMAATESKEWLPELDSNQQPPG